MSSIAHQNLDDLIVCVNSFANMSYASIRLIDLYHQSMVHIKNNSLTSICIPSEDIMSMGVNTYTELIHPNDYKLMQSASQSAADFIMCFPPAMRINFTLSYNLRIKNNSCDKWLHLYHQASPVRTTPNGKPWLVMCVDCLPTQNNDIISLRNGTRQWYYDRAKNKWIETDIPALSQRECTILQLAAQGKNISEIAEVLCTSVENVKRLRRLLFKKLGVKSINEAINFAMTQRL